MATVTMHNPYARIIQPLHYASQQRSWVITSALWPAFSFVGPQNPFSSGSCKLDALRINLASPVDNPKITADLYSDNNGVPNASIQAATESGVLAGGWNEFTWGTKPALTEGTLYWIVLKITSGTSIVWAPYHTTSLFAIAHIGSAPAAASSWGITAVSSSDGGATWDGTIANAVTGFRVKLTNDTDVAYFGLPAANSGTLNFANDIIESTQQVGNVFTTPADVKIRLKTVVYIVRKSASPGNLSCVLYTGDAVVATATSGAIPAGNISTSPTTYQFQFNPVLELAPSTKYRLVLSAASGDDSSNYYYHYAYTWDSDADSLTLKPWSMSQCNLEAGAWTDTSTSAIPVILVPDTMDEFGTVAAINLDKMGAM
jgi:hypothetical protein